MNQEDAINLLIKMMREPGSYGGYGYDVYLPSLLRAYYYSQKIDSSEHQQKLHAEIPFLYAAAWDLCRRGILRPGVNKYQAQSTLDGSAGNGYSITPFGRKWLEESDRDDYVPTEPGRFATMLEPFRARFGPGFYERSQEAVRCYGSHAYLACCAMCGGASESIMLATAIAKTGDEKDVLRKYSNRDGRKKVENIVIGQAQNHIQKEYQRYTSLIKYWRDNSAHGRSSNISDNEAYTSLALLLRFANFVNDHWDNLTEN